MPGLFLGLIQSEFDWQFYGESKHACQSTENKKCYLPRGKMLGGSSAINGSLNLLPLINQYKLLNLD